MWMNDDRKTIKVLYNNMSFTGSGFLFVTKAGSVTPVGTDQYIFSKL